MTLRKEIKEEEIVNVPYSIRFIDGREEHGYMRRKEMNNVLAIYARKAKEEMNRSEAKHVLYGIKEFDRVGAVKVVRLFVGYHFNDYSFCQMAEKQNGLVYAVHSRR